MSGDVGNIGSGKGSFVARDWMGPATATDPALLPRVRRSSRRPRTCLPDPAEHDRAARIIERGTRLLREQFDAVRRGGRPDLMALGQVAHQVSQSMRRNKFAIVGLTRLRERHEYTFVHSVAVGALMAGLGRELGMRETELEMLTLAGLLHDIGKSQVPLSVLDKPGPLDDDEWRAIQTHPGRGHAILEQIPGIDAVVLDVAAHHHERIDGTGYPHRLTGERISTPARIAAICDVYDALTSKRAYKDSRPPAEAFAWMQRTAGHFDAAMMRKFRALIGTFPAGTLVRLQRGRLGVVLNEAAPDTLHPRVRTFHCSAMRRDLVPSICDTRGDPILAVERPEDWNIADWPARCNALMLVQPVEALCPRI